jgi:hypothetical protein
MMARTFSSSPRYPSLGRSAAGAARARLGQPPRPGFDRHAELAARARHALIPPHMHMPDVGRAIPAISLSSVVCRPRYFTTPTTSPAGTDSAKCTSDDRASCPGR